LDAPTEPPATASTSDDTPSVGRRIRSGTGLLVLGRLWGSFCTFLTLWLIARQLTGEDFGRYTFYLAAFMLLDSFVDFGTGAM